MNYPFRNVILMVVVSSALLLSLIHICSIPKDFLQEFEQYLGVPSFGEIFVGDVDYVSDFANYEWGVLDFPLFFQAREVFAHDASFTTVKSILDQDYKYKDVNHLVTFIDNHDRDRFLCLADDNYQKLRLALTFLFTVRGIPDVYYGRSAPAGASDNYRPPGTGTGLCHGYL